ncbi:MAG: hypothetical protein ACI9F2_000004 [Lysobacterales bacterium]|jgi:hypothetical protein
MIENMGIISLVLGSSLTAGINLYLTAAILGVAHRLEWLNLPSGLEILAHPLIIGAAIVLYIIEFVADKVPYVDSTWDALHTFIRPAGGFVLGYMALNGVSEPAQMAVGLLMGTVALETHVAKATTRAAINTSPEPVTNVAASVTEDAVVVGIMFLVIQHPVIAFFVSIAIIVIAGIVIKVLFRFVKKIFSRSKPEEEEFDDE